MNTKSQDIKDITNDKEIIFKIPVFNEKIKIKYNNFQVKSLKNIIICGLDIIRLIHIEYPDNFCP